MLLMGIILFLSESKEQAQKIINTHKEVMMKFGDLSANRKLIE